MENMHQEKAFATPYLLVSELTPQVIQNCLTVPRPCDQFIELFASYEEVGDEEDGQDEVLEVTAKGIG